MKLLNCFPSGLSYPLMMHESSICSTSSPILGIVSLFNFSHSDGCMVVSHRGFNLHFPHDIFSCAIGHLHIFFGDVSVHLFTGLSCKNSFCVLDTSAFCGYTYGEYFLPICGLPFHFFLTVSFKEHFCHFGGAHFITLWFMCFVF